mmetsp:Transcript_50914/g.159614  ORF Transcript_50914/g.159614 Transcript_50914/m.159614 type:complete len:455 (-) Transcript_50914:71-1435(-)
MSSDPAPRRLVPHFCIIQADELGLVGWDTKHDCRQRRWDVLLEALQKCLALDGKWITDARASLFTGGDAIHVTGEIQDLAMPVSRRANARRKHVVAPCSVQAWEEMLWDNYLQDRQGLRWEFSGPSSSRQEAQHRLSSRLEGLLAEAPADSAVLAFTPRAEGGATTTYTELKTTGLSCTLGEVRHVYILMGGAHGFDYKEDADGRFLASVLGQFARRFGPERVARVRLCRPGEQLTKFLTASVAAFLCVEHVCGMLDHAVAGLGVCAERRLDSDGGGHAGWWNPGPAALEQEFFDSGEQWDWESSLGPGAPGMELVDEDSGEDTAYKRMMLSLRGTWWDTKGSMYEIAGADSGEQLTVNITRPGRRSRLVKSISLGFVHGQDSPQVLWDCGTFVVVSQLPQDVGRRPERVEWKAVAGNKKFTWLTSPDTGRRESTPERTRQPWMHSVVAAALQQ